MRIAVIIFTKNEEKIIEQVITRLKLVLSNIENYSYNLFLCDDSSDDTPKIAKSLGIEVINGSNISLGTSYYKILKLFSANEAYDLILTIDGDGQADLNEIPLFIKEIEKNNDLVLGSRFKNKKSINYDYPLINHIGVKILVIIINICTFKYFTDAHGGIRLFRRNVFNKIKFLGTHSYVQETIINAVNNGFKVVEINSSWNERIYGESRVVASPYYYAYKMILPLCLRTNIHLFLAAFLILFSFKIMNIYIISAIIILISLELYKKFLYEYNQKLINRV